MRRTQILVFPAGTGGRGSGTDIGKKFEIRPIVIVRNEIDSNWFGRRVASSFEICCFAKL